MRGYREGTTQPRCGTHHQARSIGNDGEDGRAARD